MADLSRTRITALLEIADRVITRQNAYHAF